MKLGFVADYSQDTVEFAARSGFQCLEFQCWPGGSLDATRLGPADIAGVKSTLAANGLDASSLIIASSPISADPAVAKRDQDYLKALIGLAARLGIKHVNCSTGQNVDVSIDDNIRLYGQVFGELGERAQSAGVKIGFENCPHGYPRGINLATTPELWGRLFAEVPSPAIGLEYDPSHLVWQDIDYVKGVYEFAERIFMVHAKDTEIMKGVKDRVGFYGRHWWRYRLPGFGQIDWHRFFQALREVGFDGEVIIEHEDPVFHGERTRPGLVLGKHYLDQFVF